MIERFLTQTHFSSEEDYRKNLHFKIPENFNFAYDVMDVWAEEKPDKTAMIWTDDEGHEKFFTYRELKLLSDRTASYFASLGIGHGDMVMLILKRRYEWWLAMLALHKLGAVAIPATHMLTKHDIIYRNNRAGVKAIVCVGDSYVLTQIEEAMPESPTVETLISIGPEVPEGFHDWHKEWEQAPAFVKPGHPNSNDDTMLMYFTSGTSGEPKMVAHDFLYALGHLVTGAFWHNLSEDSIHFTVADTGWGKAVWGKFYGQWFAGATVFVFDHDKFTADKILRKIEQYHITSFCAPPTIYRFMIREDFSKYDLSSLRYCCTAGEALNPAVYNKFFELTGIKMKEGFGQTIGLFKEYYRDEALTRQVWHDGIYHTGDMAWRDEDGYYWFVGRIDDVIKSSGYRIGPFEVESALMTHPAVVECAITGVPDPIRGMVVKATVVLGKEWKDKAGDALVKELQNHVKHETAPYKYPRIIEFVDELPKTISGKIRRVEIRERDEKDSKGK